MFDKLNNSSLDESDIVLEIQNDEVVHKYPCPEDHETAYYRRPLPSYALLPVSTLSDDSNKLVTFGSLSFGWLVNCKTSTSRKTFHEVAPKEGVVGAVKGFPSERPTIYLLPSISAFVFHEF